MKFPTYLAATLAEIDARMAQVKAHGERYVNRCAVTRG